MTYRGTNPDHQFQLKWGNCQPLGDDGNKHQIDGELIDSQWDDDAKQTFTKTFRFSLAGFNCRPATATLHTAPRFIYAVEIP
jgi:hypothetical protein